MSRWYKWVPCYECEGTMRVWTTLKGAGIRTTTHCRCCLLGAVRVRMSDEEIKATLTAELAQLEEKSEKTQGVVDVF